MDTLPGMSVLPLPRTAKPTSLSTRETARAAGITYRQIDYWIRRGYVDCDGGSGSGDPRRFTAEQAEYVTLLAALVHAGLDVAIASTALHRALTSTETVIVPLTPDVDLTVRPHAHMTAV